MLAISFAVLASASMVLSHLFNPGKFVAEATQALAQGAHEHWNSLCSRGRADSGRGISGRAVPCLCQPAAREALAEQLAAQAMDETLAGSAYPALGVAKDNVFLGYAKYKMVVQPVQLMLTSSAQNPLLSLNGVPRTGRVVEGGVLYEGLFPGQYTCAVTASSGMGLPSRASRRCLAVQRAAAHGIQRRAGTWRISRCPAAPAMRPKYSSTAPRWPKSRKAAR